MPLEVVVGSPFSGSGRWIAAQVEAREDAGELGVLAINYTDIFHAIAPGANSQYRDEAVSGTGVPRLAGYLYSAAVGEATTRQLSGYVAVDSPRRAAVLVSQIGGSQTIIEVTVAEQVALAW